MPVLSEAFNEKVLCEKRVSLPSCPCFMHGGLQTSVFKEKLEFVKEWVAKSPKILFTDIPQSGILPKDRGFTLKIWRLWHDS